MGAFSTSLILLGIALLYGLTGSLNMAELSFMLHEFTGHTIAILQVVLLQATGGMLYEEVGQDTYRIPYCTCAGASVTLSRNFLLAPQATLT